MRASGPSPVQHAQPLQAASAGEHSPLPLAHQATGGLSVDHTGGSQAAPTTYDNAAAKARGLGSEDAGEKGSKEWSSGKMIAVTIAANAALWSLILVAAYYLFKDAVHNGIRSAVRDGSLGNAQNRVAANQ